MKKHAGNPRVDLQNLCNVLNDEKGKATHRGAQLFELIEKWQKAPNLAALTGGDCTILQDLQCAADHEFLPSKTGKGGTYVAHIKGPDDYAPESWGIWIFAHLVTNSLCELLAGPCARCGNYYVKKRASQKVYCSRKCGNAATAIIRTRKKLKDAHRDKLKRTKAAMIRWRKSRTMDDWKTFVAKTETDITAKFLTRAVNHKEIVEPRKGEARGKR